MFLFIQTEYLKRSIPHRFLAKYSFSSRPHTQQKSESPEWDRKDIRLQKKEEEEGAKWIFMSTNFDDDTHTPFLRIMLCLKKSTCSPSWGGRRGTKTMIPWSAAFIFSLTRAWWEEGVDESVSREGKRWFLILNFRPPAHHTSCFHDYRLWKDERKRERLWCSLFFFFFFCYTFYTLMWVMLWCKRKRDRQKARVCLMGVLGYISSHLFLSNEYQMNWFLWSLCVCCVFCDDRCVIDKICLSFSVGLYTILVSIQVYCVVSTTCVLMMSLLTWFQFDALERRIYRMRVQCRPFPWLDFEVKQSNV